MRMWDVDPKMLCNKHLCGEHVEMHMFAGSIKKGIDITGYITRGLVIPKYIQVRHDVVVEEMIERGFNHLSMLAQPDVSRYDNVPVCLDVEANMQDLMNRCPDCADRIIALRENHESQTN